MTPEQERHLRALYVWRGEAAKIEEAAGAEMFLGKPDRWFEDITWGCTTGHVSRSILKCEEDGDRCLACHAPVLMIPPEYGEEKFGPVMTLLRTIAGICQSQDMDLDETVVSMSHTLGNLNPLAGSYPGTVEDKIMSLGASPLVTGSAGGPSVADAVAYQDDKMDTDNRCFGPLNVGGELTNLCLDVPLPPTGDVSIYIDDQGRTIYLGHGLVSSNSIVVSAWEIGVAEIIGSGIRWTGEFVVASDEVEAEKLAGERGYYRNVRVRGASRDVLNPHEACDAP